MFKVLQVASVAVFAFGVIGLLAMVFFGGKMTGEEFDKAISVFGYTLGFGAVAFWTLFVTSVIAEERRKQ